MQSGEVTATHLRGANLLSTSTDDETSYYLFNAHGDVTGIANEAQTVTKSYDYDAFGVEKEPSITDENPFRYCGEYFDKETGTYYLRARYYDPTIGRFTQQDTHWNVANMIYGDNPNKINESQDALGLKTYTYAPSISSIMQSGNLYVYCISNPIIYNDNNGEVALIVSIGLKFLKGVAIQYVSDVIGNIASGKTGEEIFVPTSTLGEYLASGVSELIPGSGFAKNLFSSVIEEGIVIAEKAITGEEIDITDSLIKVGFSATVDLIGGEITTAIQKKSDSLLPKNYSSYAHDIRQNSPNMSTIEIKNYYNSYVKNNNTVKKVISFAMDEIQEKAKGKLKDQILLLR